MLTLNELFFIQILKMVSKAHTAVCQGYISDVCAACSHLTSTYITTTVIMGNAAADMKEVHAVGHLQEWVLNESKMYGNHDLCCWVLCCTAFLFASSTVMGTQRRR